MKTVLFISQSGILEVQSLLLAVSLRKHAPHLHLKACVPIQFGELHSLAKKTLKSLEVEIVEVKNDFNPVYPCGNKLSAALEMPENDMSMFLDSDIICVKPFEGFGNKTTVVTTGRYDIITHLEWCNIFDFFDLEMPIKFDHIRSPLVSCDFEFAQRWHCNAVKLWDYVHKGKMSLRKIRQIDQISLTITVLQSEDVEIHQWHNNDVLQSPSEIYNFEDGNLRLPLKWPHFVVLQKGWLYYNRQGCPKQELPNPNSLAYYPEIRSMIYDLLSVCPDIDRIPAWQGIHGFYLSQTPLTSENKRSYMLGVEGNQK